MRNLELRVPPLALCAAIAAAMVALAHFVPAASKPFPGHRALGVVCLLAGIALVVAGIFEFRRVRTTVNPLSPGLATAVVASGVYRLTRNPMYLGMALILAAVAAWWASPAGILLVPAFCGYLTRFQIEPEERALRATFGAEFERYMAGVRRWI